MRSLELTEKDGNLLLRNIPSLFWVFGGLAASFFCVFGVAVPDVGVYSIAVGVLIALWAATRETVIVKINLDGETVSVRRNSLFRYRFEVYTFDELDGDFYVMHDTKTYNSREYDYFRLYLPLKAAPHVEIAYEPSSDTQVTEFAQRINVAIAPHRTKLKP